VYVLGENLGCMQIGCPGELFIGGAGLARGYLNDPELTSLKFIPNPFRAGERMYRTGDLVRYQENGNLEFLGRLDDQVKIQGYRIEPGEIEAAVLDYPGVTQAAVIARGDKPGNVRLVGYVAGSERLDVVRLRNHLQQRVSEYMVPAALLQLDTMSLTAKCPPGFNTRYTSFHSSNLKAILPPSQVCPMNPVECRLYAPVFPALAGAAFLSPNRFTMEVK
jgi:acyl-coenzyme A synthetase/AMP-(fatty) acid ligase